MRTPGKAQPFPGQKLYQRRAALALPRLVAQAEREKEITYGDLAALLGMANPRNLNFVLGCIGRTLWRLGRRWHEHIPPIEALVVNQVTRLPGTGGRWFVGGKALLKKSPRYQRKIIEAEFENIFAYPKWRIVLGALELEDIDDSEADVLNAAAQMRGRGESKAHRKFKKWIAAHPARIGLKDHSIGTIEHRIPSGDSIDVVFENRREVVAVEVKAIASNDADLARGLFQCLKYRHVLDAQGRIEGWRKRVRALLAIEGALAPVNLSLKAALGIDVVERVQRTTSRRSHQ